MADTSAKDLSYGHFGEASYNVEHQQWNFGRTARPGITLLPIGDPKNIHQIPSVTTPSPRKDEQTINTAGRHERQIQELVRAHPDVQPASSLLAELLRTSEAVESATEQYDPLKGDLLAFGTIPSEIGHRPVRIAAFATGASGSDLRLAEVQTQRRGWNDSKDAWIEVPTVYGEEATWQGEGAPIQQVCFAHAVEGSDIFLAVRMLTRTLVFRPVLRSAPVHNAFGSRLDPNLVYDLRISRTGGLPHADVVFNPWYPRQFGVIDQAGQWGIWELEGQKSTSVRKVCHGQASDGEDISLSEAKIVADGWARILWIAGSTTVFAGTRRNLAVFDVESEEAVLLQKVDIDLSSNLGWILDLRIVPDHLDCLSVLTPTQVLMKRFTSSGSEHLSPSRVLSSRHFRNPNDASLRLQPLSATGAIVLLLSSSFDELITSYSVHLAENNTVTTADPVTFSLPAALKNTKTRVTGANFQSVEYGRRPRAEGSQCTALKLRDRGVRMNVLTISTQDLAVHEILCRSAKVLADPSTLVPPTWEAKSNASAARAKKESFVVDDEEVEPQALQRPISDYMQRRLQESTSRASLGWTVSYELLAASIIDETEVERQDFETVIGEMIELLQKNPDTHGLPFRALTELSRQEIAVQDVEAASSLLNDLADLQQDVRTQTDDAADEAPARFIFRPIKWPLGLSDPASDGLVVLSDLYRGMVQDWIASLSKDVPARIRLAKEQTVRSTSAQIALASWLLRTEPIEDAPPEAPQHQQSQAWDLPVRPGPSGGASASRSQAPTSPLNSQPNILPTPSPTATPSVTTASSASSLLVAPEALRLAKYTTFSKPLPPALPRALNNVLNHWTVGDDPSDYDWRATTQRMSQRDEDEDEDLTEKERARMQRRAERHVRRQRREAAATQAAQLASSQAPGIVSASQPQQDNGAASQPGAIAGSSQTLGLGVASASQVVPGRFGGRPPARKKRKQGF